MPESSATNERLARIEALMEQSSKGQDRIVDTLDKMRSENEAWRKAVEHKLDEELSHARRNTAQMLEGYVPKGDFDAYKAERAVHLQTWQTEKVTYANKTELAAVMEIARESMKLWKWVGISVGAAVIAAVLGLVLIKPEVRWTRDVSGTHPVIQPSNTAPAPNPVQGR